MSAAPVLAPPPSPPPSPDQTPWVLVLSHEHGLLPLAWRLAREGLEVAVSVQRSRFAGAWAGRFQPLFPPGGKDAVARELATVIAALDRGAVVVTDSHLWRERLGSRPNVWPTFPAGDLGPVQLLGWTDQQGHPVGPLYLAVVDYGLWPGGQGPVAPPAAVSLLRAPTPLGQVFQTAVTPTTRGLTRVGLGLDDQGQFVATTATAGWHPVYLHAWAAATGSISPYLTGDPVGDVGPQFAAAAPVSIPPWPTLCNVPPGTETLSDLPPAVLAGTMWHDIRLPGDGKVELAGTDGLVGVVTAASHHWELCHGDLTALGEALRERLTGGQFRVDWGQHVLPTLRALRAMGLVV